MFATWSQFVGRSLDDAIGNGRVVLAAFSALLVSLGVDRVIVISRVVTVSRIVLVVVVGPCINYPPMEIRGFLPRCVDSDGWSWWKSLRIGVDFGYDW